MARNIIQVVVLQSGFHGGLHFARRAHTNGIGHAQMLNANALHEFGQTLYIGRRHIAFVRATHHTRHGASHINACSKRCFHHGCKALNAFFNAAVDVLLTEGFAGCSKHHNFVELAVLCGLKSLHIGCERGVANTGLAIDASHDFGVVCHLRHPLGADKAGDLNILQASSLETVHQFNFDGSRHGLFFILQAIAGANIDQFNAGRNCHVWTLSKF